MIREHSVVEIVSATLAGAQQVIIPTLAYAIAFIASVACLFWAATALPNNTAGSIGFIVTAAAALFAHSLFSASMSRALLPSAGGIASSAWKLSLAWILVMVVAAILATSIVLFFSLIGSSLGVVSGESGQDITDMAAQMRQSGTFYPLFALFLLTLLGVVWFAVRMMLFATATATRDAVHVFRTWAWTKGHFSGLALGMLAFIALPVAALSYAAAVVIKATPLVADPALAAGTSAAISAILLVPAFWLAHGFTAFAVNHLAPDGV